jgi:hypothetical protein
MLRSPVEVASLDKLALRCRALMQILRSQRQANSSRRFLHKAGILRTRRAPIETVNEID